MSDELPTTSQQNSRSRRPYRLPVPLEIIQKNISVSMAQIIANMTDPTLQAHCMQLLQINDVMETEAKILKIIENNDAIEQEKRNATNSKRRRQKK